VSDKKPILVTGAAGKIGGVGRAIVEILRNKDLPVRAFVRSLDERSEALSAMGAELFVGDLMQAVDVARALEGCRRMFFGMSVSPPYLEATVTAAAVALAQGDLEVFVNISQLTVSEMSLLKMTDSPQQRLHWLAEQTLNWSGLPVVHVRGTVFLEHPFFSALAASSIAKDGTIRLPFGSARTSPVAVRDVAQVIATVLENPSRHIGKVYELTGPESIDMISMAGEYSAALGRPVKYVDMPFDEWHENVLSKSGFPEHVMHHFEVMAQLHKDNRYDRMTGDVEAVTGRPAMSVKDYVISRPELFKR
jgi:NAD(P)H dehydrogenase (quinone)